jgi:imidazolonepropionase-like amidohydrolase
MTARKLLSDGVLTVLIAAAFPAVAQVPVDELAKATADARHFIIESTDGKHGDSWLWVTKDGTRIGRESMNLRGQVVEVDSSGKAGSDGMPAAIRIRGSLPTGDAAETFDIRGGAAHWKSPVDAGTAPYAGPAFYAALNGPIDLTAWFIERLVASPDHSLALLPGGKAHAVKLRSLQVNGRSPSDKVTIDLWGVSGLSNSPVPLWVDQNGRFFAQTVGIGWLPEAYAGEQAKMEQVQTKALAAQSAQLARTLVKTLTSPVVFAHVRLFDAEHEQFLADQSVVVDQGKIIAVGPAATVKLPAQAQVIDGSGKTLVPGMWDCHMHVGDDYTGVQELSLGVTSVRDPGNDDLKTIDRRKRSEAGQLLFPHVYPSSLIDGKGPYTAQVANVATSQAEAIALIDRAKKNGFTGIKFYGTFNSAWLPASIAEAHRLGLHVHGHIPVGIRPMEAINDGYDEVTHINWIIMQALPDSVIAVDNGIARFDGPGRYAKDVDLNGPAMTLIVETMAGRHIYSDPTMVAFEGLYVPENGDLSPAYAPFVGTLPPVTERSFRTGGLAVPKDLTRADYRASWAKMVALLKKMHGAGIPIVAGTDGSGIEIIRELEIYQQAGFTAAQALAAATIVPSRLVGQDQHTGSITVGKNADLALVDGDPSVNISALRQTRWVMLDGKMLDADALRTAAGYSGRPK